MYRRAFQFKYCNLNKNELFYEFMQKKYFSVLFALNFYLFLHRAILNGQKTDNSKPDEGYFYFPSWTFCPST
jgi:hypothetical protein